MLLLWILACGDKDDTSNPSLLTEPATFTQIETELIQVSCAFSSCHGSAAGDLLLNGVDDYDRLVYQPSSVLPDETLIVPNDIDGSYFIHKLITGDNIAGDLMAPNQGISEYQEALLRSWIENGAPQN